MTDRCTLGPQDVGTWPGRARGRRAYKSSRRSSTRRPCGGGPPFHPRLPDPGAAGWPLNDDTGCAASEVAHGGGTRREHV